MTLNCTLCGKDFDPSVTKTPNKSFCSKACLSKNRRILGIDLITKKCTVCGESFEADKSKHKNRETCSRSCGNYLAWEVGKGGLSKLKLKPKKCEYCEVEFFTKDKIVKYCSSACISSARIEKNKLKPKSKEVKKCLVCGKDHTNNYFCSNTCRLTANRKKDKGGHVWTKLNKMIKRKSTADKVKDMLDNIQDGLDILK